MRSLIILVTAALAYVASGAGTKKTKKFLWTGANQAGAQFGDNLPGKLGVDYIWPTKASINTLIGKGMNTFRVGFSMERAIPESLWGEINQTYFKGLKDTVNYITSKGAYAVIDPHNSGRYYGEVITDTEAFAQFWTQIADPFANNKRVIFDTNNEYYNMTNDLVKSLNQNAINAIRSVGARTQYIWVEGNSWSGVQDWVSSGSGTALKDLYDPGPESGKIIYQMHLYLDDTSGSSPLCQSTTIGVERLKTATKWLRKNGKKGVIGETAAGFNQKCITAMRGELQYLLDNSDVWTGWLWWAAGPWTKTDMYGMEPPNGIAYKKFLPHIQEFVGA